MGTAFLLPAFPLPSSGWLAASKFEVHNVLAPTVIASDDSVDSTQVVVIDLAQDSEPTVVDAVVDAIDFVAESVPGNELPTPDWWGDQYMTPRVDVDEDDVAKLYFDAPPLSPLLQDFQVVPDDTGKWRLRELLALDLDPPRDLDFQWRLRNLPIIDLADFEPRGLSDVVHVLDEDQLPWSAAAARPEHSAAPAETPAQAEEPVNDVDDVEMHTVAAQEEHEVQDAMAAQEQREVLAALAAVEQQEGLDAVAAVADVEMHTVAAQEEQEVQDAMAAQEQREVLAAVAAVEQQEVLDAVAAVADLQAADLWNEDMLEAEKAREELELLRAVLVSPEPEAVAAAVDADHTEALAPDDQHGGAPGDGPDHLDPDWDAAGHQRDTCPEMWGDPPAPEEQ